MKREELNYSPLCVLSERIWQLRWLEILADMRERKSEEKRRE